MSGRTPTEQRERRGHLGSLVGPLPCGCERAASRDPRKRRDGDSKDQAKIAFRALGE